LFFSSELVFGQEVFLKLAADQEVKTKIIAVSKNELFTSTGNTRFDSIQYLRFDRKIETDIEFYNKLKGQGVLLVFSTQAPKEIPKKMFVAQPEHLPWRDGRIVFTDVIKIDSIDKTSLYLRAKKFFVNTFNSGKDVIQFDDRETATVIGRGWQEGIGSQIWYSIKIQAKDGRVRYEIYDFLVKTYPSQYVVSTTTQIESFLTKENFYKPNGNPRSTNKIYLDLLQGRVYALVQAIHVNMKVSDEQDDW